MLATAAEDRLYLPPLFSAHRLEEGHPFDLAQARAAAFGAGALLVAERPGLLALAVVLEPETPLASARRAFPLAMAAAADALAAHCPPERAVRIAWPDRLIYDTGRIGGGRLAWPQSASETAVPDWLVIGIDLIADRDHLPEPGRFPETTSLKEEHFASARDIVESFARNLMLRFDLWQSESFDAAARDYLDYLLVEGGEGLMRRLGPTGDLVMRDREGRVEARSLLAALAASDWFDAGTGRPRL
jgi:biotin-(acetyl-CoA carboxylase) ligase